MPNAVEDLRVYGFGTQRVIFQLCLLRLLVTSGIVHLDALLGGGIPAGLVIDITGGAGVGKSHLVLQILAGVIADGSSAIIHDTTGAFRPERLAEIVRHRGLSLDVMERLAVSRITTVSEQIAAADALGAIRVVAVDGVSELFLFEYANRFADGARLVTAYMRRLASCASYGGTVIITNTVRDVDGRRFESYAKIVEMFTHARIDLQYNRARVATCSTAFNNNKFTFEIGRGGITEI